MLMVRKKVHSMAMADDMLFGIFVGVKGGGEEVGEACNFLADFAVLGHVLKAVMPPYITFEQDADACIYLYIYIYIYIYVYLDR